MSWNLILLKIIVFVKIREGNKMTDLFWNIFEKSGNLDAFMAYKEFSKVKSENDATLSDINNNIKSNDKSIIMR